MPGLTDTPPEIAALVHERLMAHTGAERFEMGCRMFEAAREMVLASFPSDLPENERRRRLYERFYGQTLPVKRELRSPDRVTRP